ncbi:MAG: nitroreductase family protein [Candidatus Chlorobium antarcticum]|nr:nitroreductase family protein [Candidatus Chlorobium antarcticum]
MQFRDLVSRSRSCRRFEGGAPVGEEAVGNLVEIATCLPSARNLQPLRYIALTEMAECAGLFPLLQWTGYLEDWPGPEEGERPTAYLVMLNDLSIAADSSCDCGIAAGAILLGATAAGFGGCIVGSVQKGAVRELLRIPDQYAVQMVIALGRPAETIVIDRIGEGEGTGYYRDRNDIHHVPKREAADVLLRFH